MDVEHDMGATSDSNIKLVKIWVWWFIFKLLLSNILL